MHLKCTSFSLWKMNQNTDIAGVYASFSAIKCSLEYCKYLIIHLPGCDINPTLTSSTSSCATFILQFCVYIAQFRIFFLGIVRYKHRIAIYKCRIGRCKLAFLRDVWIVRYKFCNYLFIFYIAKAKKKQNKTIYKRNINLPTQNSKKCHNSEM